MNEPVRPVRSVLFGGVAIIAVIVLFALVYYFGQAVLATEGDVPAASAVALPEGSEVIDESEECASGGCWLLLSVRPPEGMTPDELSSELGTTPQVRIPGTLVDPRTITVSSEVRGPLLVVRADYWSREVTP